VVLRGGGGRGGGGGGGGGHLCAEEAAEAPNGHDNGPAPAIERKADLRGHGLLRHVEHAGGEAKLERRQARDGRCCDETSCHPTAICGGLALPEAGG